MRYFVFLAEICEIGAGWLLSILNSKGMMFLLIFISSSLLLSAKKHSIIYLKNYKFCISSFILESKPKSDTPLSVTPTFYYLMYEKHLFIKNWKGCKSRKNSRLSTYTLVPGTIHCKLLIRKKSCRALMVNL